MSLKELLKSDLKTAMRAKEVVRRDCIRAINTMIKQIEVTRGGGSAIFGSNAIAGTINIITKDF